MLDRLAGGRVDVAEAWLGLDVSIFKPANTASGSVSKTMIVQQQLAAARFIAVRQKGATSRAVA